MRVRFVSRIVPALRRREKTRLLSNGRYGGGQPFDTAVARRSGERVCGRKRRLACRLQCVQAWEIFSTDP
jgi:hypothetical protein